MTLSVALSLIAFVLSVWLGWSVYRSSQSTKPTKTMVGRFDDSLPCQRREIFCEVFSFGISVILLNIFGEHNIALLRPRATYQIFVEGPIHVMAIEVLVHI